MAFYLAGVDFYVNTDHIRRLEGHYDASRRKGSQFYYEAVDAKGNSLGEFDERPPVAIVPNTTQASLIMFWLNDDQTLAYERQLIAAWAIVGAADSAKPITLLSRFEREGSPVCIEEYCNNAVTGYRFDEDDVFVLTWEEACNHALKQLAERTKDVATRS